MQSTFCLDSASRWSGGVGEERRGEEGGTYCINLATKVEVGARVRTEIRPW